MQKGGESAFIDIISGGSCTEIKLWLETLSFSLSVLFIPALRVTGRTCSRPEKLHGDTEAGLSLMTLH